MVSWNPDAEEQPEREERTDLRYHRDTCRACGRPLALGRCPWPTCPVYDEKKEGK